MKIINRLDIRYINQMRKASKSKKYARFSVQILINKNRLITHGTICTEISYRNAGR